MKIDGTNLSMIRGDTESVTISCLDPQGAPITFATGDIIYLTIKESAKSTVNSVQKVVTLGAPATSVSIVLNSIDTQELTPKTYKYDIEWYKPGVTPVVVTLVPASDFILEADITTHGS